MHMHVRNHVEVLDVAVSMARKSIEKLAREYSAVPTVAKAAVRLRSLTAAAGFLPLCPSGHDGGRDGGQGPVRWMRCRTALLSRPIPDPSVVLGAPLA